MYDIYRKFPVYKNHLFLFSKIHKSAVRFYFAG
jgi:hypothetical protein